MFGAYCAATPRIVRLATTLPPLLAALLTAWCAPLAAADQRAARIVQSLYEARTRNVVLQEWDLSCGAAALATILRYQHGESVSERAVALGLIDRPEYYDNPELLRVRQGFSFLDMRRYLERLGYDGIGLGDMRVRDLLERAPLIVPVDLGGFPHFVVFRGVAGTRVLLADPAFGNVTITRGAFEDAWIDYRDIGKVGFVVQRDGVQAPPADLTPTADEFVLLR